MIKKTSETTPTMASVVNSTNSSTSDAYSCNYLNGSVIETGGNATNGYIKYGNGMMIQWSTISGTQGTLTSWGSLYYQDVSLGNWSTAFETLYNVEISSRTNQFWCILDSATKTSKGNARLIRPDTGYTGALYNIQLLAIGTWK